MSLVGELLFTGGVPQDTLGGAVTIYAGDHNSMQYQNHTIRGEEFTVMSQPEAYSITPRSIVQWMVPAVSNQWLWSVEVMAKVPWPKSPSEGAIFALPGGGYLRLMDGMLDEFGGEVECPKNQWFLFTIRHSAGASEAYLDNTKICDLSDVEYNRELRNVGGYSTETIPNAEIAFIRIYDHFLDAPTSTPVLLDDNNAGSLLGSIWVEEVDGGGQNKITPVGDDGVNITFCGTACWGALEGKILNSTSYGKISATFNWDDYIIGTEHVEENIQILGLFNESRTQPRALIKAYFSLETGAVTGVYAEMYDDDLVMTPHQLAATALPDTDYAASIEMLADEVVFSFGGSSVTVDKAFTAAEEFMLGMNLGMHFGPYWTMRLRDVVVNQVYVEPVVHVTDVTVTGPESIEFEGTGQYSVEVLPEDATDKTGVWSSSNEDVLTVDEDGLATWVSAGSASVIFTATDGDASDSLSVECEEEDHLYAGPITIEITSAMGSAKIDEGGSCLLTISFTDSDGESVTPKIITWSLNTQTGDVVNNRENIPIDPPLSSNNVMLSGDDLILADVRKPSIVFSISATYDDELEFDNVSLSKQKTVRINPLARYR